MTATNLSVRSEQPYALFEGLSEGASLGRLLTIPILPGGTERTTNVARRDEWTGVLGAALKLPPPTDAGAAMLAYAEDPEATSQRSMASLFDPSSFTTSSGVLHQDTRVTDTPLSATTMYSLISDFLLNIQASWRKVILDRSELRIGEPQRILPAYTQNAAAPRTRNDGPAVLELRRLSGLTLDELAEMLGVTRRSLHHWANGRRIGGANEGKLYRLLVTIRRIARGGPTATRRLLLAPDADNRTLFALLKASQFTDVERLAGTERNREIASARVASSDAWDAVRPPHPTDLLGALQDVQPLSEGRLVPGKLVRLRGKTKLP